MKEQNQERGTNLTPKTDPIVKLYRTKCLCVAEKLATKIIAQRENKEKNRRNK